MNWNDMCDKQAKEYGNHLNAVKTSRDQLMANKQAVLSSSKCSEAELPAPIKDMLQQNEQNWEKEYGMYGSKFKDLRIAHQRELNKFFEREALAKDLSKDQAAAKEKGKDKSAGR